MEVSTAKQKLILDKATELFLAHGIFQVSMDRIAQETPASKMTIYKYFKDKDGLVEATVLAFVARLTEQLNKLVQDSDTPVEAIMELFNFSPAQTISEQFIGDLTSGYPELVEKLLKDSQEFFFTTFQELIYRAQVAGAVRREISAHVITLCILAIKEFLAKPGQFPKGGKQVEEQVRTIFLYGILLPEEEKSSKL
jgi:AcrR family transcriptional regulator